MDFLFENETVQVLDYNYYLLKERYKEDLAEIINEIDKTLEVIYQDGMSTEIGSVEDIPADLSNVWIGYYAGEAEDFNYVVVTVAGRKFNAIEKKYSHGSVLFEVLRAYRVIGVDIPVAFNANGNVLTEYDESQIADLLRAGYSFGFEIQKSDNYRLITEKEREDLVNLSLKQHKFDPNTPVKRIGNDYYVTFPVEGGNQVKEEGLYSLSYMLNIALLKTFEKYNVVKKYIK